MPTQAITPRILKNRAATAWAHYAAAAARLAPSATTVLKVLASATDFGTWARMTNCIAHLAKLCRLARSTVEKALRRLREIGLISRDGRAPFAPRRPGLRRVVYYRLSSMPDSPLPAAVLCAREAHSQGATCTYCVTSGDTYMPKSPTGPVVQSAPPPPAPVPAHVRSAGGAPPRDARDREPVSAHHRARVRTRPEPTAPKGRPTPKRPTPQPAAAGRSHGVLDPVAPLLDRLNPGQRRVIRRRTAAAMADQRVGGSRMRARLEHWRNLTGHAGDVASPMGWLTYAVAHAPHGCPDPACEDGWLWDPGTDARTGRCPGCRERVHGRALASGAWRTPKPGAPADAGAATVERRRATARAVCQWCERPFQHDAPGVGVCLDCRAGSDPSTVN
jgi:hypothetical protein